MRDECHVNVHAGIRPAARDHPLHHRHLTWWWTRFSYLRGGMREPDGCAELNSGIMTGSPSPIRHSLIVSRGLRGITRAHHPGNMRTPSVGAASICSASR
jgi:hypothetical protein